MCPICGETINAAAQKCIQCGEFLEKYRLGFKRKTLWDVLALIIIPVVLTGGGLFLNDVATERQKAIQRADTLRQKAIDVDRGRENALQSYFDRMFNLLQLDDLDDSKRIPKIQSIARIKTHTLIRNLDSRRKGLLLQFLHESDLITRDNLHLELPRERGSQCQVPEEDTPTYQTLTVSLKDADLRDVSLPNATLQYAALDGADLLRANLQATDLRNTTFYGADLRWANLRAADMEATVLDGALLYKASLNGARLVAASLRCTYLHSATLRAADLRGADLQNASLISADLRIVDLRHASLINTNLQAANLDDADLRDANLRGTNLRSATLVGAKVYDHQLKEAFLCETTMPDGIVTNRDCGARPSLDISSSLQTVPLTDSKKFVGTYTVRGKNPSGGNSYQGIALVIQMEDADNSLQILWTIDVTTQRFQGVGQVTENGDLYVMYKGDFSGDGSWFLQEDGSIHGVWRVAGSFSEGIEIWTPVEEQ